MLFKPFDFLILSIIYASATFANPGPTRRAAPPTSTLTGNAQWSDFDGISACGTTVPGNQPFVGISGQRFDKIDEPCGRKITIKSLNGKTHQAFIQDSCGDGCEKNDLLLTKSLFSDFYNLDKGVFKATWFFNEEEEVN